MIIMIILQWLRAVVWHDGKQWNDHNCVTLLYRSLHVVNISLYEGGSFTSACDSYVIEHMN